MAATLLLLIVTGLAGVGVRAWLRRERSLQRLAASVAPPGPEFQFSASTRSGFLARWLLHAGFGGGTAAASFLLATVAMLAVGAALAWAASRLANEAAASVLEIPGGVGEMLASVLGILPWAMAFLCALAPTLVVRSARRARVAAVDQDLPLVLELLATLAQAGLGLDAALARVVDVQPPGRPLTLELRIFQRDLLSGVSRVQALRHLAARLDVTSLSVFVAAVIQAEQIGASMADTLRLQADDLRGRRREQALLAAQALPVKLVLPLVICFLPGIFLSTLGPVLYQMIRVADSVLRPLGR